MKWFTSNETAMYIWERKYTGDFKKTIETMVSEVFSVVPQLPEIETTLEISDIPGRMRNLFLKGRGLPGGRILYYFSCLAQGDTRKITPMNCFVIPIEEDSIRAIFKYKSNMAMTFKAGGGVGTTISGLRPKGAPVNNSALSSTGPVSFLKSIDADAEVVGQNARRGALMKAMSIYHPDIFEFISLKHDGGYSCMNTSVMIDNYFMVLEDDDNVSLWFPEKTEEKPKKFTEVPYIANCYYHSQDKFFKVTGENHFRKKKIYRYTTKKELWDAIAYSAHKCGDPGILFWDNIKKDWKEDEELHSTNPCQPKGSILIDQDKFTKIENQGKAWKSWKTGIKDVIKVVTNIDSEFLVTPDHLIQTSNGNWIKAQDSLNTQLMPTISIAPNFIPKIDENEVVRGFLFGAGFINGGGYGLCVKLNYQKEVNVYDLLRKYGFKPQNDNQSLYTNFNSFPLDIEFLKDRVFNRKLPNDIIEGTFDKVASFMRGLFEANGSAKANGQISLKGTCKKTILDIQKILLSFGIHCCISENPAKKVKWHNGIYENKVSFNLQIPKSSAILFKQKIGFYSVEKMSKIHLNSKLNKTKIVVKSIIPQGKMEVWDYKMNVTPNYTICQGTVLHNCGEEPLPAFGACNLGAINFSKYTIEEENEFSKDCKCFTVFLDSLITYCIEKNNYPLPEQVQSAKKFRQIGLGITGLADFFILNEAVYGDEKSKSLLETRMTIKRQAETLTSQVLNEVIEGKTGPRNAQLSTVAPTGSTSMVLGCSGGIEPNLAYEQQKLVGEEYIDVKIPIVSLAPSKKYLIEAHQIHWKDRIAIQKIAQKYTDGSISSTINLPNSVTAQEIQEIYQEAWNAELKGITVYRDGSKGFGAIRKKETKKERGILSGKTIKVPLDTSWYITINFDEDIPREVFINAGKSGSDTKAWTEAIGRLSSLYLQSGGNATKLISALQDIKGQKTIFKNGWSIQSGPDAIAQAIGSVLTTSTFLECPNCEKMTFKFAEGCGSCESCGFEKC